MCEVTISGLIGSIRQSLLPWQGEKVADRPDEGVAASTMM